MEGTNVPWSWDGVIDNKRSNMPSDPPHQGECGKEEQRSGRERREREGPEGGWQDSLSTSLLTKANLKD